MMNAPALPAAPGAMPAGFAAFLANIGQVAPDGDAAGFGQLLAEMPVLPTQTQTPAAAAATAAQVGEATIVKADAMLAAEAETAELPVDIATDTVAVVVKPLAAKPEPADAATLAATLLVALGGAVPAPASKTTQPVGANTETVPEAAQIGESAAPTATENWATIVAAVVPSADQPAKAEAAKRAAAPTAALAAAPETLPDAAAANAPALPRAPGASVAAAPLPVDAPVARTADAPPSMTVLFTQPAGLTGLTGAAPLDAAVPATIAERVLDMDSDGAWIDQLARDIAATKSDSGDISFRLMPRHLGRLDVAMQMGDEGVSLKMDTQHEATATIVTAAQGRLVDELRQQGVRVAGAEVTHTPGETGRQSQGQSQGRAAAPDTAHLIETATERAEPRDEERAANRRGRFA
ncbi:MAG: flagellar hook-length control protein FliK [Sphingopyxis sp.]